MKTRLSVAHSLIEERGKAYAPPVRLALLAFGFAVVLGIAMGVSLLTAFYTFRAYFLTFWGEERFPEEAGHHPHDARPGLAGAGNRPFG